MSARTTCIVLGSDADASAHVHAALDGPSWRVVDAVDLAALWLLTPLLAPDVVIALLPADAATLRDVLRTDPLTADVTLVTFGPGPKTSDFDGHFTAPLSPTDLRSCLLRARTRRRAP